MVGQGSEAAGETQVISETQTHTVGEEMGDAAQQGHVPEVNNQSNVSFCAIKRHWT